MIDKHEVQTLCNRAWQWGRDMSGEEQRHDRWMIQREDFVKVASAFAELDPCHGMEIGWGLGGTHYVLSRVASRLFLTLELRRYLICAPEVSTDWHGRRCWTMPGVLNKTSAILFGQYSPSHTAVRETAKLLNGRSLDFLYIDGCHEASAVYSDMERFRQFVRVGGLIGLHDTYRIAGPKTVAGLIREGHWPEVKHLWTVDNNTLTQKVGVSKRTRQDRMYRADPTLVCRMIEMLRNGKPFSYARYNDGEWSAILGYHSNINADGHAYFPEMCKELTQTVLNPRPRPYYYGTLHGHIGVLAKVWCQEKGVDIPWVESNALVSLNHEGKMFPLVEALRKRRVLIVGPRHLRIERFPHYAFTPTAFVEVPERNCYKSLDEIQATVLRMVKTHKIEVVSFSAGMPTNILMYNLFPIIGQSVTMLDMGAVWDIYVGVKSRGLFRNGKYDWPKLIRRNCGIHYLNERSVKNGK